MKRETFSQWRDPDASFCKIYPMFWNDKIAFVCCDRDTLNKLTHPQDFQCSHWVIVWAQVLPVCVKVAAIVKSHKLSSDSRCVKKLHSLSLFSVQSLNTSACL